MHKQIKQQLYKQINKYMRRMKGTVWYIFQGFTFLKRKIFTEPSANYERQDDSNTEKIRMLRAN